MLLLKASRLQVKLIIPFTKFAGNVIEVIGVVMQLGSLPLIKLHQLKSSVKLLME